MAQYEFIGAVKKPAPKKPPPKPVVRKPPPKPVQKAVLKHNVAVVKKTAAIVRALPPKAKAVVQTAQKNAVRAAVRKPGSPLQKAAAAVKAIAKVNVRAANAVSRKPVARPPSGTSQGRKAAKPVARPPVKKPITKAAKAATVVKALPPKSKAVVRKQQTVAVRRVLASNAPAAAKPMLAAAAINAVNVNAANTAASQMASRGYEEGPDDAQNDESMFEAQSESEPSFEDFQGSPMETSEESSSESYEGYPDDEQVEDSSEADMSEEFASDDDGSDAGDESEESVDGCVGCNVGNAPMQASPRGYWVKTHFYRDGDFMCAQTFLVANGEPEILNFRVNMRKAIAFVRAYHEELHGSMAAQEENQVSGCVGCGIFRTDVGGIFGDIYKAAKGVVKSKLVKKVYGGVRGVLRSKALGAAVGVVAVAFPPVGVPAMAGYAAANAAIIAAEKGNDVIKELRGLKKKGKNILKLDPRVKAAAATAVKQGAKAKAIITSVKKAAVSHPDPRKRLDAQTTLKVLELTAASRAKLKAIAEKAPSSVTGLVVDAKGNVLHGKFVEAHQASGAIPHLFLAAKGKTTRGYFNKVSGCIGCGG